MSSSGTSSSSVTDDSWINWFCSRRGNDIFCEIDKPFIEDSFNLFGLKQQSTKDFNKILNVILDKSGISYLNIRCIATNFINAKMFKFRY